MRRRTTCRSRSNVAARVVLLLQRAPGHEAVEREAVAERAAERHCVGRDRRERVHVHVDHLALVYGAVHRHVGQRWPTIDEDPRQIGARHVVSRLPGLRAAHGERAALRTRARHVHLAKCQRDAHSLDAGDCEIYRVGRASRVLRVERAWARRRRRRAACHGQGHRHHDRMEHARALDPHTSLRITACPGPRATGRPGTMARPLCGCALRAKLLGRTSNTFFASAEACSAPSAGAPPA